MQKQDITLTDTHEDFFNNQESKILKEILKEIGHYFPPIANHITQPARNKATYHSALCQK